MMVKRRDKKKSQLSKTPHPHFTKQMLVKVGMVTVVKQLDVTGRLDFRWSPYCQSQVEAAAVLLLFFTAGREIRLSFLPLCMPTPCSHDQYFYSSPMQPFPGIICNLRIIPIFLGADQSLQLSLYTIWLMPVFLEKKTRE